MDGHIMVDENIAIEINPNVTIYGHICYHDGMWMAAYGGRYCNIETPAEAVDVLKSLYFTGKETSYGVLR